MESPMRPAPDDADPILFGVRHFSLRLFVRHCEERSDEVIQNNAEAAYPAPGFASLRSQ